MDFTREPIIETIITPKDGCKLAIKNSKNPGQEEYFVDAVEIVSFGRALFFRSLERPKAFLVPVSDYEVLEVREARMVLKNVGFDRAIKIGGGRGGALKTTRESEKAESLAVAKTKEESNKEASLAPEEAVSASAVAEVRLDKKRDRRRHTRKRKGREEQPKEEKATEPSLLPEEKVLIPPPQREDEAMEEGDVPSHLLPSLLTPPPLLISQTINRYRQSELFKGAFYLSEEDQYKPHDKVQDLLNEDEDEHIPSLQEPVFIPEEAEAEPHVPQEEDPSQEDLSQVVEESPSQEI